jgi:hypothetical protein
MAPSKKPLILSFVLGIFIVAMVVSIYLVRQEQLKRSGAASGSVCNQSPDCVLLDSPGNQGSYTASKIIRYIDITAQDYKRFNPGNTNDGCYDVIINGNSVNWNRVGSGSSCKDISNVQIWLLNSALSTTTPTATPTQPPTSTTPPGSSATPIITIRPTATTTTRPTTTPIVGGLPTPTPTIAPTSTPPPVASPTKTPTPTPTATVKPSTTPTTRPIGGLPTPSSDLASVSNSSIPTASPAPNLPAAGSISPTIFSVAFGIVLLIGAFYLMIL